MVRRYDRGVVVTLQNSRLDPIDPTPYTMIEVEGINKGYLKDRNRMNFTNSVEQMLK